MKVHTLLVFFPFSESQQNLNFIQYKTAHNKKIPNSFYDFPYSLKKCFFFVFVYNFVYPT